MCYLNVLFVLRIGFRWWCQVLCYWYWSCGMGQRKEANFTFPDSQHKKTKGNATVYIDYLHFFLAVYLVELANFFVIRWNKRLHYVLWAGATIVALSRVQCGDPPENKCFLSNLCNEKLSLAWNVIRRKPLTRGGGVWHFRLCSHKQPRPLSGFCN